MGRHLRVERQAERQQVLVVRCVLFSASQITVERRKCIFGSSFQTRQGALNIMVGLDGRSKGLVYFLVGSQEGSGSGRREVETGGVPETGQTPSPPVFPPMLLPAASRDPIHV